ncbi:MAG TPA: hypothetical protein VHV30_02460 [Polyangiaceae bacterium]|nr:hypothetical protein [Polyangiaceae bacterium]
MPGSPSVWRSLRALMLPLAIASTGCTTIDPGPDFVVPEEVFDANYFFCHVEPQFIVANKCGPGQASDNSSCHYSAVVSGMPLMDHPTIDCGGGDIPLDPTSTTGAAQSNFQAVSLEMSHDYTTAPLFVRPSNNVNHPRMVFSPDDPTVNLLLRTWASK